MRYLETIKNDALRKAVYRAYRYHGYKAYFLPSSLTGKFHPKDERGLGGLNKHVEKMCWFLDGVVKEFDYSQGVRDMMITAAYFHDLGKVKQIIVEHKIEYPEKGKPKRSTSVTKRVFGLDMHPDISAKMAEDFLSREGASEEAIDIICGMIRAHMSHWSKGLPLPSTDYEKMFALADFVVAQNEFEIRKDGLWERIKKRLH